MKEYHVWDAKPKPGPFRAFIAEDDKDGEPRIIVRRRMQNEEGFYEEYFKSLINESVRITGDITPSYSGLDTEHFELIKNRMEAAGFNVKTVFLLRDPVQRCWSLFRMTMQRRESRYSFANDEEMNQRFLEISKSLQFRLRTQYEQTIGALQSVFPAENLYIGIYEEMFEKAQLNKLSGFLGVPFSKKTGSEKKNVSPEKALDPDAARECYHFYKSTYEYCAGKFPQTSNLWLNEASFSL